MGVERDGVRRVCGGNGVCVSEGGGVMMVGRR